MKKKNYTSMRSGLMEAGIFEPSIKGKAEIKFIEDIWPDIFKNSVVLSGLEYHRGAVRYDEIVFLSSISKYLNPKKIFEFGTCRGRTTTNLAVNSEGLEKLFTLNLDPDISANDIDWLEQDYNLYEETKNATGILFKNSAACEKIVQLWGDSKEFDFSRFSNIDLVFIDASKNYEYVYSDSKNAFNMLSKNGIVIWHDYNYADGVTKAVDDFAMDYNIKVYNIYKTTLAVTLNVTEVWR